MKTALIVEGGGMKCAYSAGILDIFLDENITFDYVIGVSAGAANAASFVAGQRDRNLRFYTEHVKDPRYISLHNFIKTGSYFGLQYIYGDLTNEDGKDPIDYDAIMANPCEFHLNATNAVTGQAEYFDKSDLIRNDYRHFMATCALPVMCQPIKIGDNYYYDGGVADSIPIDKVLEDGCDRVIAIMSKPEGFVMKPQGHRSGYHFALRDKYPATVKALDHRHENYNASMKKLHNMRAAGKAMIFCPSADIKIGTYTTDPKVMQALYDNACADAKEMMPKVRELLGK